MPQPRETRVSPCLVAFQQPQEIKTRQEEEQSQMSSYLHKTTAHRLESGANPSELWSSFPTVISFACRNQLHPAPADKMQPRGRVLYMLWHLFALQSSSLSICFYTREAELALDIKGICLINSITKGNPVTPSFEYACRLLMGTENLSSSSQEKAVPAFNKCLLNDLFC